MVNSWQVQKAAKEETKASKAGLCDRSEVQYM